MISTKVSVRAALVLIAAPLSAYGSCYCSEPSEPYIPSGYIAEPYQMRAAREEVESYFDEIREYKQCLASCIEEANSNAENVIDEWNIAVRKYNSR